MMTTGEAQHQTLYSTSVRRVMLYADDNLLYVGHLYFGHLLYEGHLLYAGHLYISYLIYQDHLYFSNLPYAGPSSLYTKQIFTETIGSWSNMIQRYLSRVSALGEFTDLLTFEETYFSNSSCKNQKTGILKRRETQ